MDENKDKKNSGLTGMDLTIGISAGILMLLTGVLAFLALTGGPNRPAPQSGSEFMVSADAETVDQLYAFAFGPDWSKKNDVVPIPSEDGTNAGDVLLSENPTDGTSMPDETDTSERGEDGSSDPEYYHVVHGDTLSSVSSIVHFSVQELAKYNKIDNVNLIYAESDLRVPPKDWDGTFHNEENPDTEPEE